MINRSIDEITDFQSRNHLNVYDNGNHYFAILHKYSYDSKINHVLCLYTKLLPNGDVVLRTLYDDKDVTIFSSPRNIGTFYNIFDGQSVIEGKIEHLKDVMNDYIADKLGMGFYQVNKQPSSLYYMDVPPHKRLTTLDITSWLYDCFEKVNLEIIFKQILKPLRDPFDVQICEMILC